MQFKWFLSVLEQKRLENHEIYYIEAAEWPFFFHIAHLSLDGGTSTYYFLFLVEWKVKFYYPSIFFTYEQIV